MVTGDQKLKHLQTAIENENRAVTARNLRNRNTGASKQFFVRLFVVELLMAENQIHHIKAIP
jgi:hypothetical protein